MVKPFAHQAREYEQHAFDDARSLTWEMRTGKSKAVIDNACLLYQLGEIDGVIVIAPNGVHRNWTLNQLPIHHSPNVEYIEHAWRFSDKDNDAKFAAFLALSNAIPNELAWLTINMEVLIDDRVKLAIKQFIRSRRKFMLVVDESHHFGAPGSKRVGVAKGLAKQARYRRNLTGTPMEETPLQAYAQFQILKKGVITSHPGGDFASFENEFAEYEMSRGRRTYPVLKGYKNLDVLKARMAPYTSVVLRSDCEDLPEVQYDTRIVELSESGNASWHAFKQSDVRWLLRHGFDEPPDGGALLTKLQQVECGAFITPNGIKYLDDEPKFNVVLEEMKGYASVVFCTYIHEIELLAMKLKDHRFHIGIVHGKAPRREENIADFQAGLLDALVVQSSCVSEGYKLDAADKLIWHSATHTARIRAQGNARASLVGGNRKQVIDIYTPGGVDEYFLSLTKRKTNLADEVSRIGLRTIIERLNV